MADLVCDECDEPSVTTITERNGDEVCLCQMCLDDRTCPGCDAVEGTEKWGTVGDGFDGYCPSCADEREENGTVEIG